MTADRVHLGDDLPGWTAQFIGTSADDVAVPLIRGEFSLDDLPDEAILRSTFLGIGTVRINGVVVGDEVLEPGWQSYHHRLVYRTSGVSSLLVLGRNTIEAEVSPGWYSGRLGFFGQRQIYGSARAVLAQLDVRADGAWRTAAATDGSWSYAAGPTVAADLYDGQTFDARRADSDSGNRPVDVVDLNPDLLVPRTSPPVRRMRVLEPKQIFTTPSGAVIVDFGRNVVGWVRIRITADSGTEITLRHAEVLENDELGIRPLRTAAATDRYISAGTADETWEPSHTYHGFRYVQVDGWPGGRPSAADIAAIVVHSDLPRIGWFRTSHPALKQLHDNVVASTEGNFVSIPTDCPQRDERLGWTGDIAVFGPTASFLFDSAAFLESWLTDAALEQRADGSVPNFVPEVPFPEGAAELDAQFGIVHAAVWGDAVTLVPWAVYLSTGDLEHLRKNYPTMRRWVQGLADLAGDRLIRDTGFQFGDWLDPIAPPDDPAAGATHASLVATAYFVHSTRLVSRAARLLGDRSGARVFDDLADRAAAAFRAAFVRPDGTMTSHSQTAYAIALQLDLLETESDRRVAGRHLVEIVRAGGHRIGTGFVGTPLLLDALTSVGALDDAYRVLLGEESPSWLYAVSLGATTIWERWDSMLPDGAINPGEMTSFNHYAFGAVADWMHRTIAGLSPLEPGYRSVRVAPRPRGPITDAGATHVSPFGAIEVDWEIVGERLHLRVEIPEGVVALIDIEGQDSSEVGAGVHEFSSAVRTGELSAPAA